MALTDTKIRNAKPKEKPYKLFVGKGLFALIHHKGGKYWRLKYYFNGKEKPPLALGVYPEVSLKDARERRDEARKLLANGVDPAAQRKAQKAASNERAANSFEVVAREWHTKHSPNWSDSYKDRVIWRFGRYVFPYLGGRPIAEITAPELLSVVRRIENRALDTAHRTLQNCGQVFRYAVATGRAERDSTGDLRGALPPRRKRHHASITDTKRIGDLMRAIRGYEGSLVTRCALQLAALTFVRPGELRRAEWSEVDCDKCEWRIPAEKMKMNAPHIVPLSTQAIAVLREIHPLTGHKRYVFPGARGNGRPMSENAVNAALRYLGFEKGEMTGHGFRSMASTLLNEQGWSRDAIERQLAHAERDAVRAAYNYAEHLPERRRMMQHWADYLGGLAAGATVIPISRHG